MVWNRLWNPNARSVPCTFLPREIPERVSVILKCVKYPNGDEVFELMPPSGVGNDDHGAVASVLVKRELSREMGRMYERDAMATHSY